MWHITIRTTSKITATAPNTPVKLASIIIKVSKREKKNPISELISFASYGVDTLTTNLLLIVVSLSR